MADQRCPNCGAPLAEGLGQHALTPVSGLVRCPSCGETVTLERAGEADAEGEPLVGIDENVKDEYFSGEDTISEVMDELSEKEGGPQ
jgi:uncharacterized Zn finger protein (UPF0148 family)